MTQIRIARVYQSARLGDGMRVLVDKLWPRGLRKETFEYDLWAKDIAPSDTLRKWYHLAPKEHWGEFGRRYVEELENSPAVREFVRNIAGKPVVTLLFASKNAAENHALILQGFLQKALAGMESTTSQSL